MPHPTRTSLPFASILLSSALLAPWPVVALACTMMATPRARAGPAKPETPQAQQRSYLPALLQKALLENERAHGRSLESSLQLFKTLGEAGMLSRQQVDQVEQDLLQAQIRVLRRETDHRDAVDSFKVRFDAPADALQKIEEAALLPLTRQFQRFEDIYKDRDAVRDELVRNDDPAKAPALRALLRRLLTGSALVKGTAFGPHIAAHWAKWEKTPHKDLQEGLRSYRDRRDTLLASRAALEAKGGAEASPPGTLRELETIELHINLVDLERILRTYESQPWKAEKNRPERHRALLAELQGAFGRVLERAVAERTAQDRQTWPQLAPVRLEGVDLLSCDLPKAERIVTSLFKNPDAALAGRIKMRQVRTLAETYRHQQGLFELAQTRVRGTLDALMSPPDPGGRAPAPSAGSLTQQLLDAQRSFADLKSQLISTWIDYQILRLDLYRDLALTPP